MKKCKRCNAQRPENKLRDRLCLSGKMFTAGCYYIVNTLGEK